MVPNLRPRRRDGFVLVGVVMFVLALTILGLSLFGLSSFEAQFLGRSINENQAFDYATGGIERAKFVLAHTNDLGAVGRNMSDATPIVGAIYASAVQDGESTGTVIWGDPDGPPAPPIQITVRARYNNAVRTVSASYTPSQILNPYKYVLSTFSTLSGSVAINTTDVYGASRAGTVMLDGHTWQNAPDSSFKAFLATPTATTVQIGKVPTLNADIADFITSHAAGAGAPTLIAGNPSVLQFSGPNPNVNYFVSDNPLGSNPTGSNSGFSIRLWSEATLSVRDTVVWLLPHGVRFENLVTVSSADGDSACLVIVANPNGTYMETIGGVTTDYRDLAIWCFGAIRSSGKMRVILAAGGEARLEHFNNSTVPSGFPYVSIYARNVFLMGPLASSGNLMHDAHPFPYNNDPLIDRLVSYGALPGSERFSDARFKLLAGSWQENSP